jgi:2-hydroxy-3-keto-5-methylthiopentenyl-1-phosphate phosphatase
MDLLPAATKIIVPGKPADGLTGQRTPMASPKKHRRIVFCDFDGTITVEETFVGMLKQFATLDYNDCGRRLVEGRITLRDAVRQLIESIPADQYHAVIDYIRQKPIRRGFSELLDFLHRRAIPLVVISGGLQQSVETRLQKYMHRIHAVHAALLQVGTTHLTAVSPYESSDELVSKTRVMLQYHFDESIAIGDGITDRNMAITADRVFARDNLRDYLSERNAAFIEWSDFFDVLRTLSVGNGGSSQSRNAR